MGKRCSPCYRTKRRVRSRSQRDATSRRSMKATNNFEFVVRGPAVATCATPVVPTLTQLAAAREHYSCDSRVIYRCVDGWLPRPVTSFVAIILDDTLCAMSAPGLTYARYADLVAGLGRVLTSVELNQLMHALNGNIFGINLGGLAAKWLLGSGRAVSFTLPDSTGLNGLKVDVTTIGPEPPSAVVAPAIGFDDLADLDITSAVEADVRRVAKPWLMTCQNAFQARCDGITLRVPRSASVVAGLPAITVDGRVYTPTELFAMFAPFHCERHFNQAFVLVARAEGVSIDDLTTGPATSADEFVDIASLPPAHCPHMPGSPGALVELAIARPDMLGIRRDVLKSMHRPELRYLGHRCSHCHPTQRHHWSTELQACLKATSSSGLARVKLLDAALQLRRVWVRHGSPRHFTVSAYSGGLPSLLDHQPVFIFRESRACNEPIPFDPRAVVNYVNVPVRDLADTRILALLRVLGVALLPVSTSAMIRNCVGFEPMHIPTEDFPNRRGFFTAGGGFGQNCLFAAKLTSACHFWWRDVSWHGLVRAGHLYGSDEYFLHTVRGVHVLRSRFIHGPVSLGTHPMSGRQLLVRGDIPSRPALDVLIDRQAFAVAARSLQTGSVVDAKLILGSFKGVCEDIELAGVDDTVKAYERGAYGLVPARQIVMVVCYGSRGDRTPLRPIFRSMTDLGFHVIFVRAVPDPELADFLSAANDGDFMRSLPWLLRVRATMAGVPFSVVAPSNIGGGSWLTYSLSPPMRYLWPSVTEASTRLWVLGETLFASRSMIRVGSWDSIFAVPRSTDGVTFDVYTPRSIRADTLRAVFVPGSLGGVHPPHGVPVLTDTDHATALRKYTVAYVVGVGAAQTAAAAGCQVIMLDRRLDRCFTDPSHAERDLVIGSSPARIWGHVMSTSPEMFWAVCWQLSIFDRLVALSVCFVKLFVDHLWALAVAASIGYRFYTAFTLMPTPLLTLLTVLYPVKGAPDLLVLVFLGLSFKYVTAYTGVDYHRLAVGTLWLLVELAMSPFGVALLYGGMGLLPAVITHQLVVKVALPVLESCCSVFARPDDQCAFLECTVILMGILPAIHTRYVSPDRTLVAEGRYIAPLGLGSPYRWSIVPYTVPVNFTFSLPTAVPWRDVVRPVVVSGSYGPLFNCQVLVLSAAGHNAARLGFGLIVMLPFLLLMWGGMFLATILAMLLSVLVPLAAMILGPDPKNLPVQYVPTLAWFLQTASTLAILPGVSLMTRALFVMELYSSVWAGNTRDAAANLAAVSQALLTVQGVSDELRAAALVAELRTTHLINVSISLARGFLLFADKTADRVPAPHDVNTASHEANIAFLLAEPHISKDLYEEMVFILGDPDRLDVPPDDLRSADSHVLIHVLDVYSRFMESPDLWDHLVLYSDLPWSDASPAAMLTDPDDDAANYAIDETGLRFLRWAFFRAESPFGDNEGEPIGADILEHGAILVTELVDAGADFDQACISVSEVLASTEHVSHLSTEGYDSSLILYSDVQAMRARAGASVDSILAQYFSLRAYCHRRGHVWFFPVELAYLFSSKMVGDAARMIAAVASLSGALAGVVAEDPVLAEKVAIFVASLLDVIDVRHRTTLKPAWALLLGKMRFRLNKGDYMLASVYGAELLPSSTYEEWSGQMLELMQNSQVDVNVLSRHAPERMVFTPGTTYGIKEHEAEIKYFNVKIVETARERRMLETAIRHGAARGIDQVWLSSPASTDVSLSRYTVNRPSPSVLAHAKIIEAADAIFDDHPEMYDAPKGMTIANAIASTEWKYSAGLPFLPVIKKRSDLKNTAWIHAIRAGAHRMLTGGRLPKLGLHGFPKAQIVAFDKASNPEKLRTVTAGDRVKHIAYTVLAKERDKRLPPVRAMKLPSLARTEGGMQEIYRTLATQPHHFKTDGTRFDSTVVSEVVVEGPTRIWQRGIQGHWGERGTTAWMRAYYEGLANGMIVNLMNGNVTWKTGGGGTGSAATSKDNEIWVEVCFRAGWSMATGLPASEFKQHVNMAQASDDVTLSMDDLSRLAVPRWRVIMQEEYGVDFKFEATPGPTNILHLILLKPDQVDWDAYVELGIAPSPVAVRHDPAQLFLRRSEYRSDRMKMGLLVPLDVIATRSVGHAYLTAHNRAAYADIALDWEEAATSYMLAFFDSVDVSRSTDRGGLVVDTVVSVASSAPSSRLVRLARSYHPHNAEEWIDTQQEVAVRWLRAHKLPSYKRVFGLWTKVPDSSAIERRHARMPFNKIPSPFMDGLRVGIIDFVETLRLIPRALKDMGGEPDALPLTAVMMSNQTVIEDYIFQKNAERLGRAPTGPEMVQLCRVAPFGSATDPFTHTALMQTHAKMVNDLNMPLSKKSMLALKVILIKMLYTVIDIIIRWATELRFLGSFLILFFFVTRELDVVYALMSLGYWVAYGTASLEISNLTSRDPYLIYKWVSIALITALPMGDHAPEWIWGATRLFAIPVELMTSLYKLKTYGSQTSSQLLALPTSDYERIARLIVTDAHPNDDPDRPPTGLPGVLINGGLGSGKSTAFIAYLLSQPSIETVWLLMPNNLLVHEYANDFLSQDLIVKVFAGGVDLSRLNERVPGARKRRLVVMTYGLFFAFLDPTPRLHMGPVDLSCFELSTESDVVVIDECGEQNPHALAIATILGGTESRVRWVGMSGTPKGVVTEAINGIRFNVPPRNSGFIREMRTATWVLPNGMLDAPTAVSELHVHSQRRLLFVSASIPAAQRLASGVRVAWKQTCHVVSSLSPTTPPTGHLSATSIIDTGMNIDPPPALLLDDGLQTTKVLRVREYRGADGNVLPPLFGILLRENPYGLIREWSSPSVASQRAARVGRRSNGVVIRPALASTGPEQPIHVPLEVLAHLSIPHRRLFRLRLGLSDESPWIERDNTRTIFDFVHCDPNDRLWNHGLYATFFEGFQLIYALWSQTESWDAVRQMCAQPGRFWDLLAVVALRAALGHNTTRLPPLDVMDDRRWLAGFSLQSSLGQHQRPRRGVILFWDQDVGNWVPV